MAILKVIYRTFYNLKKFAILFSLVISSSICYSQQREKQEIEMKEFFSFVRNTIFKDVDTLIVANYLTNRRTSACVRCLSLPFEKEGIFTESEAKSLYKKIDDTTKYSLPANLIERSILVDDKGVYLTNIIYFSNPIFFRNNSYCIFSYSKPYPSIYTSNGYDHILKTILCKKERGEWKVVKTLASRGPHY